MKYKEVKCDCGMNPHWIMCAKNQQRRSLWNRIDSEILVSIASGIAMVAAGLAFAGLIAYGMDRQEVVECYQLKEQAHQYEGFFLADWQKEMCKAHGVEVPEQFTSQK